MSAETSAAIDSPPGRLETEIDELRAAIRGWLGTGPIDSPGGAFYAWVDEVSGAPAFEYPEITGYALTYLAGCDDLTSEEFERAVRAANWLSRRLEQNNLAARDGWDGDAAYTFDLGMIAAGLISFGRRCESEGHIAQGMMLASTLRDAIESDNGLGAIPAGSPATGRGGWSTEGKPHLLKVVQSLLLADEVGLTGARDAATALVGEVSVMQREDGSFPTQPGDGPTMLHPHIYTLEGLWMWGTATGDQRALDRARAGTEWAWAQQLESGAMPRFAPSDGSGPAPEQGDTTSQAIRMAVALGLRPEGLEEAVRRLLGFSRSAPGGAALIYQPSSPDRHHNAWVSMFGGQALDWVAEGPGGWATLV